MKFGLVFLFLFAAILARGDVSYWDDSLVRSYVHSSEVQRRWAMSFLAPHLQSTQGNEKILDIGCGDGKITADISCFVPNGEVVGIDPSSAMIHWASKQYNSFEYPNLFFSEGGFLEPGVPDVIGPFDWIVSFCALQHCPDIPAALRSMKALIKEGGKLFILVPAVKNPAWNQARATVQNRPQWVEYWKKVIPRNFLSVSKYTQLLEEIGFQQISVREVETIDPFFDMEELLVWLEGTFTRVIPESERRQFYTEWMEEYLRLDPTAKREDGVILVKMGNLWIKAEG